MLSVPKILPKIGTSDLKLNNNPHRQPGREFSIHINETAMPVKYKGILTITLAFTLVNR